MQNRSFLQYPMVSLIDLMIGRQSLELVSSTIITIGIVVFLLACDIDPMPHRPVAAAGAIFSAVLLGMGFGLVAGVITMIWPLFNIVYTGVVIVAWVSSGLVINPEAMPSDIGENLAWNPLLHSVEWMRYAYYDDFPARLLDKTYVISVGAGSLALGLLAERLLRVVFRRG